jgi:hypothetical protein
MSTISNVSRVGQIWLGASTVEARLLPMRRRAALVALIALLGGAACGGGSAGAAKSPSASPSAPRGGPAPAQLAGMWEQTSSSHTLNFSGTDYTLTGPADQALGNVAVNGSEIDFFNGSVCAIPLPGGIGRYRWSISTGSLIFSPLNSDPCPRAPFLADPKGWQRPP